MTYEIKVNRISIGLNKEIWYSFFQDRINITFLDNGKESELGMFSKEEIENLYRSISMITDDFQTRAAV